VRRPLASLLAILAAACRTFGPVPPDLEAVLPAASVARTDGERRVALVDLDTKHVTGRFTAVVVVRYGDRPAVRAQVIPEIGGKLLDLVVSPDRVRGYFPQAEPAIDYARSSTSAPPIGLLSFLAASLLEEATPITRSRICGARRIEDGWELELRGALEGVRVVARCDAEGRILGRAYSLGGVGWRERFEPVHVFESRGFRWTIVEERRESIPAPPDALFELAGPGRTHE
jgi:hypothetical protein